MKIEPQESKYCKINIEVSGEKTEIYDIYSDSFKCDIEELGGVNFINLYFDQIRLIPFGTLQEQYGRWVWDRNFYSFFRITRQYKKISFNINKLIKIPYFKNVVVNEDGNISHLNCIIYTLSQYNYVYETIEEAEKAYNIKNDSVKAKEEIRLKEAEKQKNITLLDEKIKENKDKLLDILYKRAMGFFK